MTCESVTYDDRGISNSDLSALQSEYLDYVTSKLN